MSFSIIMNTYFTPVCFCYMTGSITRVLPTTEFSVVSILSYYCTSSIGRVIYYEFYFFWLLKFLIAICLLQFEN